MSDPPRDPWHVLSPYLDEALTLSEENRIRWLDQLAANHPTLARELRELLKEHQAAEREGFLEKSVILPLENLGLQGQTLGAYRLIRPIGHGGMGTVWLAERCDGRFERQVAVKFLTFALAGHGAEERFKREGAILGRLSHPNIADLLDAGVTSSGEPFLVLEYVEGDPIDRYCDDRKLDVQERIRLFLDVLGAVAHAHANLIVHRDIKPSNVEVSKDGQVKLLDFGIAKLLEGEGHAGAATLLTREAGSALTPEYAAPEQVTGKPVTTATDVYALGVLLYLLLTGQHPLGPGPHSPAILLKAITENEPKRASEAVSPGHEKAAERAANRGVIIDKLRRQLRGDLDTIVAKSLKKSPRERYASVTAMADDLGRYLRNEPISARPDTLAYRATKFIRRNRAIVALAIVALLATTAGVAGTLVKARAARIQRDFALRQLARAERINDFNELLLTDVAPSGKPLSVEELLDRAAKIVEQGEQGHSTNDAADHVELLTSVGGQLFGMEQIDRAFQVLQQAYQLSRGLSDSSTRARAACTFSWVMVRRGEIAKGEALVQEGLHELPSDPSFSPARQFCLLRGSELATHNGDAKGALERGLAAKRALEESPIPSDLQALGVWINLGGAYGDVAQFREGNEAFAKASVLLANLGYGETQRAVKLYNDWAFSLNQAGRPLEAERAYRRAIEISRANATEDAFHPALLYNYSGVLRELGRVQEAAHYAERAYMKAHEAGDRILMAQTTLQLARVYRDQHELTRAATTLSDAETQFRSLVPPGHYAFGAMASEKALVAQARGDIAAALRLADEAVTLDETAMQSGGAGAVYLPILLIRRSSVRLAAQQPDQAAADASRALALLQATLEAGAVSSNVGRAFLAHGRALQAQGKASEAGAAFRSAAEHLEPTLGLDHPDTRAARQLAGMEVPPG